MDALTTMKTLGIAYSDCFSGISGDMVLGALVDAGADLRAIEAELRKLKLPGWSIAAAKVQKRGIFATHVKVEASETHHHRGLSVILRMIDEAGLAPRAAERAGKIFTRLGEAEAHVHQMPIEKVHFHEVGAHARLLEDFGADEASCLFATLGFWQGVDVPGRSLSLVTLDRLPFARPDDPLAQARRERAGDAAFRLVDLPRAATLLAQGVGRLVRAADDYGVVAVLDPRLATAGYRGVLLAAPAADAPDHRAPPGRRLPAAASWPAGGAAQ